MGLEDGVGWDGRMGGRRRIWMVYDTGIEVLGLCDGILGVWIEVCERRRCVLRDQADNGDVCALVQWPRPGLRWKGGGVFSQCAWNSPSGVWVQSVRYRKGCQRTFWGIM